VPRQRLRIAPNRTVLVTALGVLVVDAASKAWARRTLTRPLHVLGPLWLRLQYNAGISFSLNRSGPLVTTVVTTVVALALLVAAVRARNGAPAVGFGLLVGGGVANVVDRLMATPHRVTDFIAVGSFPVFNAADVAVTCGFVVLLVVALRGDTLMRR